MLKKLSRTTNFILIGIIVGLFVGVSIRQVFGQTETNGTARADNLTVNMSANTENGLIVANGNLLVPNGNIGIGTTTPTTSLDVVGTITASTSICIGTGADVTCITRSQLQALLAVGGTGTGGTGGTASTPTINSFTASPTSITAGQSATLSWTSTGADTGNSCALNASGTRGPIGLGNHPANDSFAVSPTVTTTYDLSCGKSGLFSLISYVTVTVPVVCDTGFTLSSAGVCVSNGTTTATRFIKGTLTNTLDSRAITWNCGDPSQYNGTSGGYTSYTPTGGIVSIDTTTTCLPEYGNKFWVTCPSGLTSVNDKTSPISLSDFNGKNITCSVNNKKQ